MAKRSNKASTSTPTASSPSTTSVRSLSWLVAGAFVLVAIFLAGWAPLTRVIVNFFDRSPPTATQTLDPITLAALVPSTPAGQHLWGSTPFVPRPSPLPTLKRLGTGPGGVPIVEWDDSVPAADFARFIASRREIVLLKKSPTSQTAIPEFRGVIRQAKPLFTYESHDALESAKKLKSDENQLQEKRRRVAMPAKDFFALFNQAVDDHGESAYFSENIDGAQLAPILGDVLPFARPLHVGWENITADMPGAEPGVDFWDFASHMELFIGKPGMTTQTHFDRPGNFYAQFVGIKRFVMSPPSAFDHIYLHPISSPRSRQSQVDSWKPHDTPRTTLSGASAPRAADLATVFVDLVPGDLLYMPPHTFHRVETIEPSISCSNFIPATETRLSRLARDCELPHGLSPPLDAERQAKALKLGLPVNVEEEKKLRALYKRKPQLAAAAIAYALRLLVARVHTGVEVTGEEQLLEASDWIREKVVDQRYVPLASSMQCDRFDAGRCPGDGRLPATAKASVDEWVESIVRVFDTAAKEIRGQSGWFGLVEDEASRAAVEGHVAGVRDLILADTVDNLLFVSMGGERMCQFAMCVCDEDSWIIS